MSRIEKKLKKKRDRQERIKKENLNKKKPIAEKENFGNKFSKSAEFERNFQFLNISRK